MIVYGRGCAGCQTIPQSIQPQEPKELPEGAEHGSMIAYQLHGCRCRKCQEWALASRKPNFHGERIRFYGNMGVM